MARIRGNAASVSFDHVTKTYPGSKVAAVNDVSFTIAPGKLVTLLGPSGCGKTTTLRMIAGLEMPTAGRIRIGEADVTNMPATERDVSMVFQSYALFPHMTVMENVSYGLRFSGFAKKETAERAAAGLQLVGLSGFETRLPSELSGGQQQRVAVARALVLEPQVLLFDEPLSNLDAKLRRHVREEIRDIQRKLALTVVYVTHDQEEALAVSDRIIVMNKATIAQEGTPRELYEAPASAFVADFIGEANLLPCEVEALDDGVATVRVGTVRLSVKAAHRALGPARIAVRPNRIGVSAGIGGTGLRGKVQRATYVGRHMEYIVQVDGSAVFVVSNRVDDTLEVGADVTLTVAEAGSALVD